jgi:hypothetical protein
MARSRRDLGYRQQVMAGSRPLDYSLFIVDINIIACCWSCMENHTLFPTIWPDFCLVLEFGL